MTDYIPVNEPLLIGNEKKYLAECIDTGWVSSEGPFVGRFESEFATAVNRKYGVAVSNGSAALDVAVAALDLGAGDEVIMPAFTIISCAAAIVRAGATPVLVDSDPDTWNMDPAQIAEKITPKTKAIMVVHIYGLPVDMEPILALAEKHNLYIIEDAAEAIGLAYKRRPCGSFGHISTFSFYPNKHITTGEGGMVLTDDPKLAERCRSFRNLCFQPGKRFVHEELGWNFRMSNLQAAIGVAQLEQLSGFLEKKRAMGKLYNQLLSDCEGLQLPLVHAPYADNIYWVFGIVLKHEIPFDGEQFMRLLAANNIGTRPFFWPIHEQPVFRKLGLFRHDSFPISERLARRGLYLPSGLALTNDQIERVASTVKEILG